MIRQDPPSARVAYEEEVQFGKKWVKKKKKQPAPQALRTDDSAEPRYDVFLSFRGKDTRKYFTDDLYHTLVQEGISTFRDDDDDDEDELELGPHIVKAIEESRLIIVILSTNYASSTRCLDLLVKAFDSQKVMPKKQVRPIFYDVEPREVRRQTGNFGEAFSRHTNAGNGNTETVQKWTDALTNLSDISGWDLRHGYGLKAIQMIVRTVLSELNPTASSMSKGLVAMDSRVEQVVSYLDLCRFPDVLMIGICGMGGIGKTTIAREVFNRVSSQFDCCSFLGNVRVATTNGQDLVRLQEQLLTDTIRSKVNIDTAEQGVRISRQSLSHKRVLIIVDDVDVDYTQCGFNCVGLGSRIIITSRDKHKLKKFGVDKIYEVEALNEDEALQLFSRKCFEKDQVEEDILQLSKEVVEYAGGIPFAIEVLASVLRLKNLRDWSSEMHKLKERPNKMITDVLKVSYDELDAKEQVLFLDIACFFNGEEIDRVTRILEGCGSIQILIDKSLVTLTTRRRLSMHNLIQNMGWDIVRQESPENPGQRSRLLFHEDIIPVLEDNKATSAVKGIYLNFPEEEEVQLTSDAFIKMRELRFLKVHNANFSGKLKYLSNELRLLDWYSYPLKSLPSNFQADRLVELIMHSSHIKQLWSGAKKCGMLKLIDLRYSKNLIKTPDLSGVPELQTLVLEGCTSLVTVHPSIGLLKKLALLNMRDCISVKSLPPLGLESLELLIVSGCSRMRDFPTITANMGRLLELHLDGTAIKEIPESIERLTALSLLNLEDCKNIYGLPRAISFITSLKTIKVKGCSNLTNIPEYLGSLECLEELDRSGSTARRNLNCPPLLSWLQHLQDFISDWVLPSLSWLQHLQNFISDWVLSSFLSLLPLIEPDLLDWILMEGEVPNNHNQTSTSPTSNNIQVGLILLFEILKCLYQNYCSLLMVLLNRSMESTSSFSATIGYAYGKEAESAFSKFPSPIENIKEGKAMETRNVKENVVTEEDKSSPEHLQGLFLYCSLFPEDFEFTKQELVQLWIADGLDMKESEQETMEDAGIKHFNILESRGFFMRSRCDSEVGFDLVFSVPMYSPSSFFYRVNPVELSLLSSAEYFRGVDSKLDGASGSTTKHLSLICEEDSDEMIFGFLQKFKNLRTLHLLSGHGSSIKRVPADLFLSLNVLTTLNLSRTLISGLPSSIGDVQSLRYLDVSYTLITRLPASIGSLIKLQTLKLRGCTDLFDLPRSLHRLTALRHLDFDIVRQLDCMPSHLGKLSNLQSLSAFLVGRDDGRRIGELKTLNDLGGALRIFRLENVSSKAEAEEVDLKSKKRLQRLDLRWTKLMGENSKMQEDILNALQPPEGLKELQILFYNGTRLPFWLSNTSITDLVLITLYKCSNCELLPSLGRLPKLKFLSIVEMNKVNEIDQTFFRSSDHPEPFKAFPELEILEIDIMLNLKDWKEVKEGDLESLIRLTMESCPELVTVPTFSCLRSLKYMEFKHCPKLLSLDCNALPTSLESLIIQDCPELKEWCQKEGHQDLGELKSCADC